MQQKLIITSLTLTLLSLSVVPSFAAKHGVLGASTSDIAMPATVEGPGFILPDSPFYFLDTVKQQVRLFLAFSPENKAKVHADVAGERLAELRIMLARNNQTGAVKALDGVGANLQGAANDLEDAKLQGKDTSRLAQSINTSIKEKQDILTSLQEGSGEILQSRVNAVQETLKDAKLGVIASLPGDQQAVELENDINREIANQVHNASESAVKLENSLNVLNKLASEAAQKNQTPKEEALKKAIAIKNELLTKEKKKELETENQTQQKTINISNEEAAAARETVKKAQEAAEKFRKAQAAKQELQREARKTAAEKSIEITVSDPTPSQAMRDGGDDSPVRGESRSGSDTPTTSGKNK